MSRGIVLTMKRGRLKDEDRLEQGWADITRAIMVGLTDRHGGGVDLAGGKGRIWGHEKAIVKTKNNYRDVIG